MQSLHAAALLDYLRDYDLNDYALGTSVSVSNSPYVGAGPMDSAYPTLTSFRHPAFTDDWLVIAGDGTGLRWSNEQGLVLGLLGRVETLGFGSTRSQELRGLEDRKWSWELGPAVGWRAWPVHVDYRVFREFLGRHSGMTSELAVSYPLEWPRGYLVPSLRYVRHDQDFMGYYYGISTAEASPSRPAYSPGAAGNVAADISWGYRLSDLWLLSGSLGLERLPGEARNSPIVEKDSLWSFSMGLAYNADLFQPIVTPGFQRPRLELHLGVFRDSIDTTILRESSFGPGSDSIDIEDLVGAAASKTLAQTDIVVRRGLHHRFQLGHFELSRSSTFEVQQPLTVGDTSFAPGSPARALTDTRVTRLSYGYSILSDAQKEFGFLVGVHSTIMEAQLIALDTGDTESVKTNSPLPVIGAYGSADLGKNITLAAQGEFFRLQFDGIGGAINMLSVNMKYRLLENLALGLGYNYYQVKLDSDNAILQGQLRGRHRGPYLSIGLAF